MIKIIAGVAYIIDEPDTTCSVCGEVKSCRPYGKDGAQVCYECGMKDKKTVEENMERLFGKLIEQMRPVNPSAN